MASGTEMMIKQLLKALGLNPDDVLKQINGIGTTIGQIGAMMRSILELALMANRRLARIEAHIGLSDIEPVPHVMVIEHDPKQDDGPAGPVAVVPGLPGGR